MEKLICILTIILCFQSCQQKPKNELDESVQEKVKTVDTINEDNIRVDTIINRDSINQFLSNPFDLFKFKQNKNGSLSGGADFKDYHFKPDFNGIGYRFFMFNPKTVNFIRDGKQMKHSKVGYIGTNKKRISFREDGLVIKTFQPNDKYKNKFLNPNEILIELVAKFNDFDLPELAFVGLDSTSITKKLGSPDYHKNKCLIYQFNNKVLILKMKNKTVIWLKYVNLKKGINILEDDKILDI